LHAGASALPDWLLSATSLGAGAGEARQSPARNGRRRVAVKRIMRFGIPSEIKRVFDDMIVEFEW
jgi:hypothetical protein